MVFLFVAGLCLSLSASPVATAATYESKFQISLPVTGGTHYDRNASVLQARDGSFWLFFARSVEECTPTCNPDALHYNIYYMNSRDPLTWTAPKRLSDRAGIDNFYGRTIAATQDSTGNLWVFWASGGNSNSLYYYTFAPNARPDADVAPLPRQEVPFAPYYPYPPYFNVEAVVTQGRVWVFYEDGLNNPNPAGIYVRSTATSSVNWSAPAQIAAGYGIPKVIVDGKKGNLFRLVMVNTSTDMGQVAITSGTIGDNGGTTWSAPISVVEPHDGITNWDPTIFKDDRGKYNIFYAPDLGTGAQRIEWKQSSDPDNWSNLANIVTSGGNDANSWWDYWPEATSFSFDKDIYLFYTSEQNGAVKGTGHIFLTRLTR
ncbi:MAG TPA: hypothetical protein VH186_26090 [Chloroflexia bacterium]|nr:hypothetical protein [Chloroflexia bacterium]